MRRTLLAGFFSLALAGIACGQQSAFVNDGIITNLTNIDALNFTNNGLFTQPVLAIVTNVNLPLLSITLVNPSVAAYDFSDVTNFVNNGLIATDTGITFDTAPSQFGNRHMAAGFNNGNTGQVFAGSATNQFFNNTTIIISTGGATASPKMTVSATNVFNTGLLDVGANGVISVAAGNADLRFGTLHLEGVDDLGATVANVGIFNSYWGLGLQTNTLTLGNFSPPDYTTPDSNVTNIFGATDQFLTLTNGSAFANVNVLNQSNIISQAVFVLDYSGKIATDVRFVPDGNATVPIVQWSGVTTNTFTGQPLTNTLYLEDFFGAETNFQLVSNAVSVAGTALPQPENYDFVRAFAGYNAAPVGNTPYSVNVFSNAFNTNGFVSSNQYTAYGVQVAAQTAVPDPTAPTSSVTNVGGRIEILANQLNLAGATITGPNYVHLVASNDFISSTNAQIVYPTADINLRTTNGILNVANVAAPNVPRMSGPIDMYSARWTNVTRGTNLTTNTNGVVTTNAFNITNSFHVLMVLSDLSASTPVFIKDLALQSDNGALVPNGALVINDIINVTNSLFIDAQSLTIATNGPGFPNPTGQLNIFSPAIIWSSSITTNLHFFTNWGSVSASNTVYFQTRLSPNFPSPGDGPYSNFVNHGPIMTAGGDTIWAGNFTNTGLGSNGNATITAGIGPISITAGTALLTNSLLSAPSGGISLSAGSLTISNQAIQAAQVLTLSASNLLTDGVAPLNRFGLNVTNVPTNAIATNVWTAGAGLNLLVSPGNGDLLGTTITVTAPAAPPENNIWAAADRGISPSGYANNSAVGHLVLNGTANTSVFHFEAASPVGTNNALYVDLLELQNGATNRTAVNNTNVFTALNIDTNMTIYFASAVIGNLDISEKLDGANGGRLHWVSSYAGLYSSTNLTYPDGQTFVYNRPLRASLTIDSDGDGTVNGADSTPFGPPPPTPASLALTITVTNNQTALISWEVTPLSTNYLYYRTLAGTNWQVLTNFVQGPNYDRVTVTDATQTGRLYKVMVNPVKQ